MREVALRLGAWCLVMGLASAQTPAQTQYQYPFQNPNLSIEERATNIISLLTPEEKIDVPGCQLLPGQESPSLFGASGDLRVQPNRGLAWVGARQSR